MSYIIVSDPYFEPCESPNASPQVTFTLRNQSSSSINYSIRPLADGYNYTSGTLENHLIGPYSTKTHTFTFARDGKIKGIQVRNHSDMKQGPETRRFFVQDCHCPNYIFGAELDACHKSLNTSSQRIKFFIQNTSGSQIYLTFHPDDGTSPTEPITVPGNSAKFFFHEYSPGNYNPRLEQEFGCTSTLSLKIEDCLCKNVVAIVDSIGDCLPNNKRLVRFEIHNPTEESVEVRLKFNKLDDNSIQATQTTIRSNDRTRFSSEYAAGNYVAQLFVESGQCEPIEIPFTVQACSPPTTVDCSKLIVGSDVLECENGLPQVSLYALNQSSATISAKWDLKGNGSQFGPDFTIPAGGIASQIHGYQPGVYTPKLIAANCEKQIVLQVADGICQGACVDPTIVSFLVEAAPDCDNGKRRVQIKPVIQNPAAITRYHWTIDNSTEVEVFPGQPGNTSDGSITIWLDAPGSGNSSHSINLVAFAGECFTSHTEEIFVQGCNGACPELGPITTSEGNCDENGKRRITIGVSLSSGTSSGLGWTLTNAAGINFPISDSDDTVVVDLEPGNYTIVAKPQAIEGCSAESVQKTFSVGACKPQNPGDPEKTKCGSGLVWAAVSSLVIGILVLALQNCLSPSATSGMVIAGWALVAVYAVLMLIWGLVGLFSDCEIDWCEAIQIHIYGLATLLAIFYPLKQFLACFWQPAENIKDVFVGITVAGAAACGLGLPEIIQNEVNRLSASKKRS